MSGDPGAAAATQLLDHSRLDLDAATRITYRIDQAFHYSYDSPVTALSQRLVVFSTVADLPIVSCEFSNFAAVIPRSAFRVPLR